MITWTINGTNVEDLGVRVTGRIYQSLNADELNLDIVNQDVFTNSTGLNHNDDVTLRRDGVIVFQGKVETNPLNGSGDASARQIRVLCPWRGMERQVFQRSRRFYTGLDTNDDPVFEDKFYGYVVQRQETTGERIREVLEYCAGIRGDFQVGSVAGGIPWTVTESKDQKCAEVVRRFMELNPSLVQVMDHSTTPPTISIFDTSTATSISHDLNSGIVQDWQVDSLDNQVSNEVVIRYERPIISDDGGYTEIIEDTAGGDGTGTSDNAYVRSISIDPQTSSREYIQVETEEIVQASGSTLEKSEWWVEKNSDLKALNERVIASGGSDGDLAAILNIANTATPDESVTPHTVTVIGVEEREPLNPQSTPITPSTDPSDYPNELISGAIAEWTGSRYRQVQVTASIGVLQSDVDAVSNQDLKAGLEAIFTIPRTFDGTNYLTSNFSHVTMGTNADSGTYSRLVSYDPGEAPPTGIASALLAEYSRVRYSGAMTFKEQDADVSASIGQKIRITNGEPAWSTMDELVQSVSIDDFRGETSITFGPPRQLTADDLIDRLRSARSNPVSYQFESNEEDSQPTDANGGIVATPNSYSTREGGLGGADDCILGDLLSDTVNAGRQKIRSGFISGGGTSILLELDNILPVAGDYLYVEVDWEGVVEDDILLEGGSMTGASIEQGALIPDDDILSATSPNGSSYVPLGSWESQGGSLVWNKASCGGISIRFACGGFNFVRS